MPIRREALILVMVFTSACSSETTSGADGADGKLSPSGEWVLFTDPASSFSTSDVYDAEREVVSFDALQDAMVSSEGTMISGWTASGIDLAWDENPTAFRVLFGVEAGEPRAYFTETLTGTICNLEIFGADDLKIYATSETPPRE